MVKKALVTGITGQDGSHLTGLLLAKGYEVHGVVRRTAAPDRGYLERAPATAGLANLFLHHGDLADAGSLTRLLEAIHQIGLHASNGILFNHESPRRGENFVTRKICRAAPRQMVGDAAKAKKLLGWQPEITLAETIAEMVPAELAVGQPT